MTNFVVGLIWISGWGSCVLFILFQRDKANFHLGVAKHLLTALGPEKGFIDK